MDIQGGEDELIRDGGRFISDKVAYLVVGTHSRAIEGRIVDLLQALEWRLEIERPAILTIENGSPKTRVDGIQGWVNPRMF
jgi:hypothetical protein